MHVIRTSRLVRFLVAAATACLLSAGLAPSTAPAEPATPVGSIVDTLRSTLPGTDSTQSVITCTIQAQYPHDSSHVPGTVNEVGTITCTSPVSSLSITVELYYSGVLVASSSKSNGGQAFIAHNAATSCVPGYYQGRATGYVVFPPGYVPPSGFIGHTSPSVFVDCI